MSFDVDFDGRLNKVRPSKAKSLQAVFEAIANSFDATEDLGKDGEITITILKHVDTLFETDAKNPKCKLDGYEIADNGIGFTDEHLAYFRKADTTNKPSGLGVGRFTWLHVFDHAEIDSTYKEGKKWLRRSFTFSRNNSGVLDDETRARAAQDKKARTVVRLAAPKADRENLLPQNVSVLANQLLEHFLPYFTAIGAQSLIVRDNLSDDAVDVSSLYREVIGTRHAAEPFEIREHSFTLHHVLIKPKVASRNAVNLCARRRVVRIEPLSHVVPEVGNTDPITADVNLRYHAYVTGAYLDSIVNDERTELTFADEVNEDSDEADDLLVGIPQPPLEGVTKRELMDAIASVVRIQLRSHIEKVRQEKEAKLVNYAREQPQFRPYVERAKKHLERLKGKVTSKKLDLALYEAKYDGQKHLEALIAETIDANEAQSQAKAVRERLFEELTNEANAARIYALSEYVCSRRAVLSVLRRLQEKRGGDTDKDNAKEAVIHNLIFPRYRTSDEIPPSPLLDSSLREISNLWLVDERLVFHRLLASDIAPSRLRGFISASSDPTDVVIFDPAFSATDDMEDVSNVTILEFKRPGRNDYRYGVANRDPVLQIINYGYDIRSGSIEDKHGQKRAIPEFAKLYAYIVADLTDTMKEVMKPFGFEPTSDGKGRTWFHPGTRMLIEVIPWDKLIFDAERRNKAFFQLLEFPSY